MKRNKNPLVNVTAHKDGHISIEMDKARCHYLIASLSQAMCGSFDVAGEHESEVFDVITGLAVKNLMGQFPKSPRERRTIH
ncbi:hypothetical protein [uncultured Dialister sp.]|uniref:hypothetical protein n=1 Tax=uncultured Dialister sp. TaxID=278064 RepID=UPI0025F4B4D7|nr:hypothetical protein [uncultured Dialister sp.]